MDLVKQQHTILYPVVNERTADILKKYASNPNTQKAYQSDLNHYQGWITANRRDADLPHCAGMIADYLEDLDRQEFTINTMKRRLAAISVYHQAKGHTYENNPTGSFLVRKIMESLRRKRLAEDRPVSPVSKQPARVDIIRAAVAHCASDTLIGLRDKAVLLIGFSGALRRSELVALRVCDVQINIQGADLFIKDGKGDKKGEGETVSITRSASLDVCPVAALVEWLNGAGITSGPIFRSIRKGGRLQDKALSCKSVANLIKKQCFLLGLNPADFGAHSLRSGLLTSAAEAGADGVTLSQHARHKDPKQTMIYIQHANRYKNNPTAGLL